MKKEGKFSFLTQIFLFVSAFILGGTGLALLFNSSKEISYIVGGFALIGIAVAIIKKIIENG